MWIQQPFQRQGTTTFFQHTWVKQWYTWLMASHNKSMRCTSKNQFHPDNLIARREKWAICITFLYSYRVSLYYCKGVMHLTVRPGVWLPMNRGLFLCSIAGLMGEVGTRRCLVFVRFCGLEFSSRGPLICMVTYLKLHSRGIGMTCWALPFCRMVLYGLHCVRESFDLEKQGMQHLAILKRPESVPSVCGNPSTQSCNHRHFLLERCCMGFLQIWACHPRNWSGNQDLGWFKEYGGPLCCAWCTRGRINLATNNRRLVIILWWLFCKLMDLGVALPMLSLRSEDWGPEAPWFLTSWGVQKWVFLPQHDGCDQRYIAATFRKWNQNGGIPFCSPTFVIAWIDACGDLSANHPERMVLWICACHSDRNVVFFAKKCSLDG